MKKTIRTLISLLVITLLSACAGEPCTEELIKKKTQELTEKMSKLAMTDPSKLTTLTTKMMTIGQQVSGDDLDAQCEAMDEIIDEIDAA